MHARLIRVGKQRGDEAIREAHQKGEARHDDDRQFANRVAPDPDDLIDAARRDQRRERRAQHVQHRNLKNRIQRDLERPYAVDRVIHRGERHRDDAAVEQSADQPYAHRRRQRQAVSKLGSQKAAAPGCMSHRIRALPEPIAATHQPHGRVQHQHQHDRVQRESEREQQDQAGHSEGRLRQLERDSPQVAILADHHVHEVLAGDEQPDVRRVERQQLEEPGVAHAPREQRRRKRERQRRERAGGEQHDLRLCHQRRPSRRLGGLAVIEVVDRRRQSEHHDAGCEIRDQRQLLIGAVVVLGQQPDEHHRQRETYGVLQRIRQDQQRGLVGK